MFNEKIKVKKVKETERLLAFHHTKPSYRFHVVIVPKEHIARLTVLESVDLIKDFDEVTNLNYKIEFEGKHGSTEAHFVALKVKDINVQIILNEESIGYDWMLLDKVKEVMKHEDEKKAFDLVRE